MSYAEIQNTIYYLRRIHQLFLDPDRWGQGDDVNSPALRLDEAFEFVGVNDDAYRQHHVEGSGYPLMRPKGDLKSSLQTPVFRQIC